MPEFPRFISIKEFAARNGLGIATVERRCKDQTLPCLKVGKCVRIPEDALVVMLNEQGWVKA